MYYIYIVRCADETLYCGYANDVSRRVKEHNECKVGARYTKARRPVELIYSESFKTKKEALLREIEIKKMKRVKKLEIVKKCGVLNSKDAYGQQLWEHFNDHEVKEIIERDDGFIDVNHNPLNYFAEYSQWPEIQKKAVKLVRGKTIDIGGGAGRVALYLQEKNIDVLVIDNSPLAVKVCKLRGVKKARVLPVENIDKLKSKNYETVIMFGNNLGLLGTPKKARVLLEKMASITTDNAQIIAEGCDPHKTNDPYHLSYHKLNKSRGRMAGELRLRVRFKNYIGDWFDYLFVSLEEIENILKGTKWVIDKVVGEESPTYIVVIKKRL